MEDDPNIIAYNFNWSWHDFCGRDNFVVWNSKHRDFDICFQFIALQIPILCLIAIASSYYLAALYEHVNRRKKDRRIIKIRYLTTLCLSGFPIIRGYMEENLFPGELQPVDYLMAAIQSSSWFIHFCYLVTLTNRKSGVGPSIRGHVFLGGIWTMSYVLTWINLHSNYLIMINPDTNMYASGVPYKFSLVNVILQTIYLCTLFPSGDFVQHSNCFESISQSGEHSPLIGQYSRFREDEAHYLGVPMEGLGFFSRLLFSWVNPLIKKGVAGKIQTSDELYVLPLELTPSFQYDQLTRALYQRRQNYVEQKTLLKALHKCFWKEFYCVGILKLIGDLSGFCGPLILNLLVKFIEDKNEPIKYGYAYAFGLSISALIGALCDTHYNFLISIVGLKIKGALISLIYSKTLSTNLASTSHLNSGEITNYISVDMDRIVNSCASFHALWSIPMQIIITLYLLYLQVQLSFLSGLAFSIVLIGLNKILAQKIVQLSQKTMAYKDDRLRMMEEIFRGIKAIKYFVWENIFFNKVQDIRKDEMRYLSKRKYLDALCVYFWATTPVIISLLTFTTYSLSGNQLTASTVFTTIALLNMLILPLNALPWVTNGLTEAWVSIKRLERLLMIPNCQLSDYYSRILVDPNDNPESIVITNGKFKLGNFVLDNINLNIKEGQLIAVIGSVGSGKSSLISAILSEVEKLSGSVSVMKFEEGFGYVGQIPWLRKGTIQENILFGEPFVQGRYNTTLQACKLIEDIDNLPGRDNALIGESGCTLSGGQKARIALARAVYQNKSIYLLDDVLSAVDPQVARHIFNECICGVLANKTRLLFTHESRFLINADHIVEIQDGQILRQGRPSEILNNYNEYVLNIELDQDDLPESEPEINNNDCQEKEEDSEEKAHGSLDWSVVRLYIMSTGTCLWPLILASLILMQISRNGADYWLSFWVSQTNYTYPNELPFANSTDTTKYLIIYGGIAGLNSIFTLFRAFLFAYGGLSAAKKLQNRLLKKVIDAKMVFFETNSTGRINNRFSSDISTIDDSLPFIFNILVASFFGLLGTLTMTLYGLPWLFCVFAPLIPFYHNYQSNYRLTSRELKRISSTTMSPLYSHFNETLRGAVTIRAFRANSKFIRDNSTWLEANIQALLSSNAASQWLALRLQLIGVTMISGVGIMAIIRHHLDFAEPGLIGLAISYALTLTSSIGGLVNSVTETEREMISVERVNQYLNDDYEGLIGEDKSSTTIDIPYNWPGIGVISFHNVSFRYREDLPYSLKEVNFVTRPKEKIGIVGRTGAGKSSLISALFRMCELERGEISIDWRNIKLISLNELRSRMCIIPQDPFIFYGSVRDNLDPNLNHTDEELIDVLLRTRMLTAVQEIGGLDMKITKDSFSSGQAQLLCLARAILKNTKIICIDEATANVDDETDRLIQETIRESFRLCTVITIAHRVRTIMDCDRVLVMANGQVLEFDTPSNLLNDRHSHFFHLANLTIKSQTSYDGVYNYYSSSEPTKSSLVALQGGMLINRKMKLEVGEYVLKEDLIVDHNSELILQPGTTINFAPTVGITIRGTVKAEGNSLQRIKLRSLENAENITRSDKYRLVDGSSTLSGRLQAFHLGKWRSVCSNSRRWSRVDVEVICREMGWLGGTWVDWIDREPNRKPRLLIIPNCTGTESMLEQCEKFPRQMGGPTCDYHPDIAIQCFPQHDPKLVRHNWRGLRFENAKFDRYLTQENTFYVPYSESTLSFVDIEFAGSGRDYNASSAVEVIGVPPQMSNITISNNAFNGINITRPIGPIIIKNSAIFNNRGYGIFVNSSDGGLNIENSQISDNDGDGIKYYGHEYRIANRKNVLDLCTLPTTSTQTFPLIVALQQNVYSANHKECGKYFFTKPGHILTVNFLPIQTNQNGSSHVTIYDGFSSSENVLASFPFYNMTKPQSVSTNRKNVFIKFFAKAFTETYALIRITSGPDKWYDLNITDSTVSDNNGRGVAVENLRSRLYVYRTSISHNNHIAGVHVKNGAGQVNVTESRISFNIGDGINITYAGGSTNVSKSSLSSNIGSGIQVWFNTSLEYPEFLPFNYSTVVQYSEIFKNIDQGILVGNFCGDSIVNVTGNWFNLSLNTAIEIKTCWKENSKSLKLIIGHNNFVQNKKLGIKITPAVNLKSIIEFNRFEQNIYGGILIKNEPLEIFDVLPSDILIRNNEFYKNQGVYVLNLGLSPYSDKHSILFTWNFVRDNKIIEPYESDVESKSLIPRSRVAAPVVISSENVIVFRNIIENSDSAYEIGAHLQDQSKILNCTYNWLGSAEEKNIFARVFDRKDRYNLAKIQYLPYLLHRSNPGASTIMSFPTYVPQFLTSSTGTGGTVGGEVDGLENLRSGEYIVERDINVRPGGRLALEPGVTLKFPPGVGMMVAGKLEARGKGPNDILLTLKEEPLIEESTTILENLDNEMYVPPTPQPEPNVRLIGGETSYEGTLQVKINNQWGTVCNYGWTKRAASLVCNQLGLTLNPNDWRLYRSDIPHPGTNDPIILTNVECTDDDFDITECKSEKVIDFQNACTHLQDVLMRCYPPHWAGLRLSALAERSHLQYITIQQAGILDYSTNEFKPALQIDFAKHTMENVRLINNANDGLGIVYSDIYSTGGSNTIKNCEFSNNKGSGISFKQLGLRISGSKIENNKISGIRHNPVMTNLEQRELSGWFKPLSDITSQFIPYEPIMVPQSSRLIEIEEGNTKYILTQKVTQDPIEATYFIKCKPGFVIGLNLLNPIHNRSTEEIYIHDAPELASKGDKWSVKRDINIFPTTSTSYGVVLQYNSGVNALGMTVIAVSTIRAPKQVIANRITKGPIPTLTVHNTRIKSNKRGIWASFYNRYLSEIGEHYLRKSNESIHVIGCDISHNEREAVLVDAPYWRVSHSNLSEISFVFNTSLITDNGRGFYQFSRDLRNSTNLFHWSLNDNSVERNSYGGFEVLLPYVWEYNENFTHSISLKNNTWRNNRQFGIVIGGHFSHVNITNSDFTENKCRNGLISIQGMEKHLRIMNNIIERNIGIFMVQFKADSQSEIMGELQANFIFNTLKKNNAPKPDTPSGVILFDGVQKVRIKRNLISDNQMVYALVAGVRTSRLESSLDVSENWWGTKDSIIIKQHIFDFDDWNDHALAIFHPFLVEDNVEGSLSVGWEQEHPVDLEVLGGRLTSSLTLYPRPKPYLVISDLTVLPGVNLRITPGVVLEFVPRVGILVLGTFTASGLGGKEIIMRQARNQIKRTNLPYIEQTVRLCTGNNCTGNEGFVERWNATTQQWVPVCDERFSERNAEVTCRQLMRDNLDIYVSHDRRYELHHSDTSRIWSWHEPLQCTGDEHRLEDCEIRLNGQVYGHIHRCNWDSQFVFVHCGRSIQESNNWGGLRFANAEFEQSDFENRIHDVVTHSTLTKQESTIEFVNITGAGLLHSQKSPAILAVAKSPIINNVNISDCVDHGISIIAPADNIRLLFNRISNNLGVGINIASITGEGKESEESSFTPLKNILLPYRAFSLVDMCDPSKEIIVQERILLYYIYDNRPVNCVKIFYSAYQIKPFGFRLLQFNLYNSTDRIDLYDGGLYNHSVKHIASLNAQSAAGSEMKLVKTLSPRMSLHLVASAASQKYGFIAEIVTLPISAIGFNRDVQHNISYSVISQNKGGAVQYSSVGEVNPRITIEKNQLRDNCIKMYGNFTSCKSAVYMDLQNTQNLHFRNNLVQNNQGGLFIRSDSRGLATSLKGWIHNNLFTLNQNHPALSVEGRHSPYQEVTIYYNFWTKNYARYENTIRLQQVVSNFTFNYIYDNIGANILEVSGFDRVRLPIYQSTSHNGFYWNLAVDRDRRSTITAGTAGQHYVDNIFFDPDNDYEIVTVNRSFIDVWQTPIDAKHNYWGYNETLAVMGRIRDRSDQANLLEVDFRPFLMDNSSVLDVKCPPSWHLVGDTCYLYVGAPMSFFEAREFCRSSNASMPYVMGNYLELYKFLRKSQETYQFYDRVWIQHIDRIHQCTSFTFQKIELDYCNRLSPFVCEMDPRVIINPFSWRADVMVIALIGCVFLALLLIGLLIALWFTKSRHRHIERLERRNSIRQSLHSIRSFGSSHAFSDMYNNRRSGAANSTQSSPNLNKTSNYKKMAGSVDSIEKSQFNSSNEEDTQSYDIYEAHNPATTEAVNTGFDLSFRNQGFRDNSTFASQENSAWQSTDDYLNSSTLPLNTSLAMSGSTVDIINKSDYQSEPEYQVYYERPKSSAILETNLDDSLPPVRSQSEMLLETNLNGQYSNQDMRTFQPLSKSQPLETAM